ncbi:hypothetical protein CSKR_109820 [Clonorchis sinensis]|uniref:Uncharacterized protein n=1 Tax=Clonorchis sinensis TaxID=79923 RepID=A0A3R7CJL6_CLOSI|nr:hypothetical protein CSKR_109820 [Clonorchis sinensis]
MNKRLSRFSECLIYLYGCFCATPESLLLIMKKVQPEFLQTIEQGSKTLICISFTKLNIHLLLERVFLNFPGY